MQVGSKIYSDLQLYGLPAHIAAFATAQSAHETAAWRSNIFNENNNAFGMKAAGQQLVVGVNRDHAVYETVEDSVKDFVKWWQRRRIERPFPLFVTSLRVYVDYLKTNNYFDDSIANYLSGTERYYKQIFG